MVTLTRRTHRLVNLSVFSIIGILFFTYFLNGRVIFLTRGDYKIVKFPASNLWEEVPNYPSIIYEADVKGIIGGDDGKEVVDNIQRENATLFALFKNSELSEMIKTIENLEDRFNKNFHYDWNFMNDEEFTTEAMVRIRKACSGRVIFTRIPKEYWSLPEKIDTYLMERSFRRLVREKVLYGDSLSYRHMCRFNSGFFYRMNVMNQYQYYWRVEPSTSFLCDIPEDPFKVMREGDKKYGFTMALLENRKTVRQLWKTAINFFDENLNDINPEFDLRFVSNNNGDTYNMCHFWSNFEIANLDFYRNSMYNQFFNYLDDTGNFFYERWGDAPVHSIATAFLLKADELQYFPNTGYGHNPHRNCPQSDSIRAKLNCACEVDDDFTYSARSCVPKYLQVFKHTVPDGGRNLGI